MTAAPDDALARALALLCLEGDGTYRRPARIFFANLRRSLPRGHAAAALDDEALSQACVAVRPHLGDVYRVAFLRARNNRRPAQCAVRLIRNPRTP
ncbi:hypothetical protein DQE82_29610 [Micromonospora sp. LHW51205]|uniref:hypothetical protein n=1 Tax=Micromonospora sp. LHW51205 TaxID=2248752 RepID=UPI000DE9EA41|nr:hypothetical protein [Micromonospora sp. LHW51205]RBQ03894.1 hypothetical protein DQE82_29610 [Micromonospora sp. LHW51205]